METNNQKNDQNIIPNDADKQQKGVNVPNLRFSQFVGNWVKVNIKDILKILYGKDYKDQGAGNIPVYGTGGIMCYINNYLCNWNCVCIGRKGTINKPIYIDQPFWCVDTLFYSKAKNDNSPKFQYYLFQTINWDKLNEASGVPSLSSSTIENIKIFIPNTDEQKRIADFLSLIDQRIDTQSKIIEKYKSLINTIRTNIFNSFQGKWTKLCNLVENKSLQLNRGNIIPKHPKDNVYKYPVYSSSVQKDGLMGYSDYYMFDKELITWSIDGGGDIFFREKHKFCVTNVCGILQLDTNKFSYRFVAEALKYQHSKMTFDYQTKAHPSVVEKLYSLPDIELNEQNKYSKLFELLYSKLSNEQKCLEIIKEQKKYLLSNMFI